jgi:hypothetical protein
MATNTFNSSFFGPLWCCHYLMQSSIPHSLPTILFSFIELTIIHPSIHPSIYLFATFKLANCYNPHLGFKLYTTHCSNDEYHYIYMIIMSISGLSFIAHLHHIIFIANFNHFNLFFIAILVLLSFDH